MPFVRVCAAQELAPGQMVRVKTKTPIALCNVDGDEVECGWHCARFSIRTGEVTMAPATRPIQTFEVRLEGDDVLVLTPDD